ncbi:hypothetical protein SYNPS1DRAFT_28952 [Syncephalis pseudoplumigaleata]|uniref:Uncharacterized protein n=1 Tax=Syncephalis pseudoplumigaleata TaxID=1712513 RepID=A0A4P9YZE0_9FUNG|nr:hypothetical protein SYNPS1DRAFT_28952 [Syncephalis pseudoplumigaleata]|eukprot:RKP25315.1 hypothetical protein SYNPS1DRAFT_28952 [Syncephalis pseudoplumigaleata]
MKEQRPSTSTATHTKAATTSTSKKTRVHGQKGARSAIQSSSNSRKSTGGQDLTVFRRKPISTTATATTIGRAASTESATKKPAVVASATTAKTPRPTERRRSARLQSRGEKRALTHSQAEATPSKHPRSRTPAARTTRKRPAPVADEPPPRNTATSDGRSSTPTRTPYTMALVEDPVGEGMGGAEEAGTVICIMQLITISHQLDRARQALVIKRQQVCSVDMIDAPMAYVLMDVQSRVLDIIDEQMDKLRTPLDRSVDALVHATRQLPVHHIDMESLEGLAGQLRSLTNRATTIPSTSDESAVATVLDGLQRRIEQEQRLLAECQPLLDAVSLLERIHQSRLIAHSERRMMAAASNATPL